MINADKRYDGPAEEILRIASLSRLVLIERWRDTHDRPPPKGISRRLLEYNAAYAIQVKAFGGLKLAIRRKLERDEGSRIQRGLVRSPTTEKQKLSPGARLVRDWHGQTYTVDVVEDGFRYHGQEFRSLSQIAREITGARWSGPRFFGL